MRVNWRMACLFLNNVGGSYYIIKDNKLYAGTVKQAMNDQLAVVKGLRTNPYIEYDNGIVDAYTLDCKSFRVTKEQFELIRHKYWAVKGDLVITDDGGSLAEALHHYDKNTQELVFGSNGVLDFTPANVRVVSLLRKAEVNESSGFTGDLLFPNPLAIVHVTGYEGFFL